MIEFRRVLSNIETHSITKHSRQYRTLGSMYRTSDLSISEPTNTQKVEILLKFHLKNNQKKYGFPMSIAIFFGQMGKEFHLIVGTCLITKILRHHMTFGMICIENYLSISEPNKIGYFSTDDTGNMNILHSLMILT